MGYDVEAIPHVSHHPRGGHVPSTPLETIQKNKAKSWTIGIWRIYPGWPPPIDGQIINSWVNPKWNNLYSYVSPAFGGIRWSGNRKSCTEGTEAGGTSCTWIHERIMTDGRQRCSSWWAESTLYGGIPWFIVISSAVEWRYDSTNNGQWWMVITKLD